MTVKVDSAFLTGVSSSPVINISGMKCVFLNFLDAIVEEVTVEGQAVVVFPLLNIAGGKKCKLSLEQCFVPGDCDVSLGVLDCIIFSSTAAAVAPGASVLLQKLG